MTNPIVTDAMIEAGVCALMDYPERTEIDIPQAVRDVYLAMIQASGPKVDEVREVLTMAREFLGQELPSDHALLDRMDGLLDSLGDAKG